MAATRMIVGRGARASVRQIGLKAHRYLTSPGFSGRVIAAGSRAVYIATDSGELLAACPMDQQPHPRSFLTDLDLSALREGLVTWTENNELHFSNEVSIEFGGSQIWHRPSVVPQCAAPWRVMRSRGKDLLEAAQKVHNGENLGLVLSAFVPGSHAPTLTGNRENISPLIIYGVERMHELLPVCRLGDLKSVLRLSEQLIGLGPGLTPSGDDFVGGLLFMVRKLNAAYPQDGYWREGNVQGLLARSKTMTSHISHALLTDLSEGQSHESLHKLAEGLVDDVEDFDAEIHVRRVTQIGQSSGWDILTGMLAGLLPVIHRA